MVKNRRFLILSMIVILDSKDYCLNVVDKMTGKIHQRIIVHENVSKFEDSKNENEFNLYTLSGEFFITEFYSGKTKKTIYYIWQYDFATNFLTRIFSFKNNLPFTIHGIVSIKNGKFVAKSSTNSQEIYVLDLYNKNEIILHSWLTETKHPNIYYLTNSFVFISNISQGEIWCVNSGEIIQKMDINYNFSLLEYIDPLLYKNYKKFSFSSTKKSLVYVYLRNNFIFSFTGSSICVYKIYQEEIVFMKTIHLNAIPVSCKLGDHEFYFYADKSLFVIDLDTFSVRELSFVNNLSTVFLPMENEASLRKKYHDYLLTLHFYKDVNDIILDYLEFFVFSLPTSINLVNANFAKAKLTID